MAQKLPAVFRLPRGINFGAQAGSVEQLRSKDVLVGRAGVKSEDFTEKSG